MTSGNKAVLPHPPARSPAQTLRFQAGTPIQRASLASSSALMAASFACSSGRVSRCLLLPILEAPPPPTNLLLLFAPLNQLLLPGRRRLSGK